MANTTVYSRRFTDNGAAIKAVGLTDRIDVAIKTTVTPELPLGFRTDVTNLQTLSNYVISTIQTDGLDTIISFKEDGGLLGDGSSGDPLRIDYDWLDKRYYANTNYTFSQVGTASDFALPLAGSYFSVSYPYINQPHSPSAFLEANGEVRFLKHVTNGETIVPTYSFWPNYINKNAADIRHTDIQYTPPGLTADEYIGRVFQATNTAMLGEIWTATGFKEWVFIELNGTFDHRAHRLIRLGSNMTNLFGGQYSLTATRNLLYNVTINAVIQNGVRYVACVNGTNNAVDGSIMSISVGAIDENGSVTRLENWTTTNPEGLVTNSVETAIIYQNIKTDDPLDKSALLLTTDMALIATVHTDYGSAFGNRMGFGPIDKDGNIILILSNYTTISSGTSTSCKPVIYMKLNIANRTLTPAIPGPQRPTIEYVAGGRAIVSYAYLDNSRLRGHWGRGWELHTALPDGNRLVFYYTSWSLNTPPAFYFFFANGLEDPMQVGRGDLYFVTADTPQFYIYPKLTPPTAVHANGQANIIYDKLIQYDSAEYNGNLDVSVYKSMNTLIGSPTAKTYDLINGGDYDAAKTTLSGFALNDVRVEKTNLQGNFNAFEENGVYGYHNAAWGKGYITKEFARFIDTNADESVERWKLDPTVADTLDAWVEALICPEPQYTDNFEFTWYIIPPFPGIGSNRAFVKVAKSWKYDEPSNVYGVLASGAYYYFAMLPCTYVEDVDGNLTLTSLDVSAMPSTYQHLAGGLPKLWVDIAGNNISHKSTSAFKYTTDKILCQMRGGNIDASIGGNTSMMLYGRQCLIFDKTTFEVIDHDYDTGLWSTTPTLNPVLGYGIMTSARLGAGAFYYFRPVDLVTNIASTDTTTWRIVSSARPPAGFSFTVSSPIEVYTSGSRSELPIGVYNLYDITSDPRNKTFYLAVAAIGLGVAELIVSETPVIDNPNMFHLGTITTTETEISEINATPITRWENYRPSVLPIGSAIPVSTGTPGSEGHVEYVSGWGPETPSTDISLTGNLVTTENFNNQQMSIDGPVVLYDKFVEVMGRAPYYGEAVLFTVEVDRGFIGEAVPSGNTFTNTPAIRVGTQWPNQTLIRIVVDGVVVGIGGHGSRFTDANPDENSAPPVVGDGGDAILNDSNVKVSIINRGWITGGGGGGGWGRTSLTAPYESAGGGGGAPYGPAGYGAVSGAPSNELPQQATFTNGGVGGNAGGLYYGGQGGIWDDVGLYGTNVNDPESFGQPGYSLKGNFVIDENTGPMLGNTLITSE